MLNLELRRFLEVLSCLFGSPGALEQHGKPVMISADFRF